jgi:hypothetical protein
MNTETKKKKVTDRDLEFFLQAFQAAEELYAPMGFASPCWGCLHHRDLQIELLPFWDRGDETPIQYALRSAYEAGRRSGLKEAQ